MAEKQALFEGLPKGSKRGHGTCENCGKQYPNRGKPKNCTCGHSLGGSYSYPTKQFKKEISSSVEVYRKELPSGKVYSIRSVKTTTRNNREFVVHSEEEKICFTQKCKDVRGAYQASGKLSQFTCRHLDQAPTQPEYSIKFTAEQIQEGLPDQEMVAELKRIQNEHQHLPTVVKTSDKNYAVLGDACSSHTLGYVHVRINKTDNLECSSISCKRSYGRTKQVKRKTVCTHLHFVLLARKLMEKTDNNQALCSSDTPLQGTNKAIELEDAEPRARQRSATIALHMQRKIPYQIPKKYVTAVDIDVKQEGNIVTFEPENSECERCGWLLGESLFPQGSKSIGGNGYLFSNRSAFMPINIKIKKCKNSECRAINTPFPIEKGYFNACNKIMVGLDIMLDWRELFKEGFPVTNFISAKIRSILARTEAENHPSDSLEYLTEVLYSGFYGFEAMTERTLDDTICGLCGIVGKVYLGDGNEKNCCSLNEISLNNDESQDLDISEGSTHLEEHLTSSAPSS
eukprot:gene9096-10067_t